MGITGCFNGSLFYSIGSLQTWMSLLGRMWHSSILAGLLACWLVRWLAGFQGKKKNNLASGVLLVLLSRWSCSLPPDHVCRTVISWYSAWTCTMLFFNLTKSHESWLNLPAPYQRLKIWYFIPPCLTLPIMWRSRVKMYNQGKEVVPSRTARCSS